MGSDSVGVNPGTQRIWSQSSAYFVKKKELQLFLSMLEKTDLGTIDLPENSSYQLFNREYAWSPGCDRLFETQWTDVEVETGEKIVKKQKGLLPIFVDGDSCTGDLGRIILEEKEWESTESPKIIIGKTFPASYRFYWEEGYDASQNARTVLSSRIRS